MNIYFLIPALLFSHSVASARIWSDQAGRTFEGELVRLDSKFAYIERTEDRRQFAVARAILSEADQAYVKDLEIEKEITVFMAGVQNNFSDAAKISKARGIPAYIFYRNKLPPDNFKKLVQTFLMRKEFLEKIQDRCILTIIDQEDAELERRIASWVAKYNSSPMMIFRGLNNQSVYLFSSGSQAKITFEEFLGKVEEQLTHAEDNR